MRHMAFLFVIALVLMILLWISAGMHGDFDNNAEPGELPFRDLPRNGKLLHHFSWFFFTINILPVIAGCSEKPKQMLPVVLLCCSSVFLFTSLGVLFSVSALPSGIDNTTHVLLPFSSGLKRLLSLSHREVAVLSVPPVFAVVLGFSMTLVRQMASMANSGLLPSYLKDTKQLNGENNVVLVSVVVGVSVFALMVVLRAVTYGWPNSLFNSGCVCSYLVNLGLSAAYCVFRRKYNGLEKPFNNPLGSWVAMYGSLIFVLSILSVVGYRKHIIRAVILAALVLLVTVSYYVLHARAAQCFSEEEQRVLFVAYVINANTKQRLSRSKSARNFADMQGSMRGTASPRDGLHSPLSPRDLHSNKSPRPVGLYSPSASPVASLQRQNSHGSTHYRSTVGIHTHGEASIKTGNIANESTSSRSKEENVVELSQPNSFSLRGPAAISEQKSQSLLRSNTVETAEEAVPKRSEVEVEDMLLPFVDPSSSTPSHSPRGSKAKERYPSPSVLQRKGAPSSYFSHMREDVQRRLESSRSPQRQNLFPTNVSSSSSVMSFAGQSSYSHVSNRSPMDHRKSPGRSAAPSNQSVPTLRLHGESSGRRGDEAGKRKYLSGPPVALVQPAFSPSHYPSLPPAVIRIKSVEGSGKKRNLAAVVPHEEIPCLQNPDEADLESENVVELATANSEEQDEEAKLTELLSSVPVAMLQKQPSTKLFRRSLGEVVHQHNNRSDAHGEAGEATHGEDDEVHMRTSQHPKGRSLLAVAGFGRHNKTYADNSAEGAKSEQSQASNPVVSPKTGASWIRQSFSSLARGIIGDSDFEEYTKEFVISVLSQQIADGTANGSQSHDGDLKLQEIEEKEGKKH
eukprot:gene7876-8688_t